MEGRLLCTGKRKKGNNMKTIVETTAAPYTSVKYLTCVEACNFDPEWGWQDEVECNLEKSFDSFNDALHYLDTITFKDVELIMKEFNRSCVHVSIDKCFYINDEHCETISYIAGVNWIDGKRTYYINSEAYMNKPY